MNAKVSNDKLSSPDRENTYGTIEIFRAWSPVKIDQSMQVSIDGGLRTEVRWISEWIWIGIIDSMGFQTKAQESQYESLLGRVIPRFRLFFLEFLIRKMGNTN